MVNCSICRFKRSVPDSTHIHCIAVSVYLDQLYKPNIVNIKNGAFYVDAITAAINYLELELDYKGVENYWCWFPFTFDPVWIKHCKYNPFKVEKENEEK